MRRIAFLLTLLIAACGPVAAPSPHQPALPLVADPNNPNGPDVRDDSETLPAAPTNLGVVAGDATVTLTWNAVTDADGYRINRAAAPDGPFTTLDFVHLATYTDGTATNGQTYYYTVQTKRGALFSASTAAVAAQPSAGSGDPGSTSPVAPANLALRVLSGSSIRASWIDSASDETGYTVERAVVSGAFATVASLAAGATSYTSSGLVSGTTYRFRVRVTNAQSALAYSPEVSATTVGGTPGSMASVSAGCFVMGDTFDEGLTQDGPAHTVCLSNNYEIDTHEVTNAGYRACVTAGSCTAPANTGSRDSVHYYDVADFDAYPVVYVTWAQATGYCTWAGKRLPTEAEWEKAARGGLAAKRFSWGDTITCGDANYTTTDDFAYDVEALAGSQSCSAPGTSHGDTTLAGTYAPNAAGLYDMAGNVMEWVEDRWDSFTASAVTDPTGPAFGTDRVLRGGDNSHDAEWAKVSFRTFSDPAVAWYTTGFRCAR